MKNIRRISPFFGAWSMHIRRRHLKIQPAQHLFHVMNCAAAGGRNGGYYEQKFNGNGFHSGQERINVRS